MVMPISNSGPTRVETKPVVTLPPVSVDGRRDTRVESSTPAGRFAKLGPPIDVNRVTEIRAAIAGGRYTVDADQLAAAMLALDLPARDA